MINNFRRFLKQIFKSSGIIFCLGFIIAYIIAPKYCYAFVVGFIVSIINFVISGIVTEKSVYSNVEMKGLLLMVSFVIRIILIAAIGVLLVLQNQYNAISYVIGYMSNFISLFMAIKYEEERK